MLPADLQNFYGGNLENWAADNGVVWHQVTRPNRSNDRDQDFKTIKLFNKKEN